MRGIFAALVLAGLGIGAARAHEGSDGPLRVVATIQPVHSLAAAVMEGAGAPQLLVKGAASEHTFSLRPSDARTLSGAEIVIRVSRNLESFLDRPIHSLSQDAKIVTLAELPGIALLPARVSGTFEPHVHDAQEEAGHGHDEGVYDPHLWLSPANAAVIADHLAAVFGAARPQQAALFTANAEKLKARLAGLDADLRPRLAALAGRDFIVFHDAYQYFEAHFGIHAAGSITLGPQNQPGAARLTAIRARIARSRSPCVFAEPQFEPKLVQTVIEGTDARTGTLDGLGAALEPGPELYFQLLTKLTESLEGCLK
ncbi:MULTISPECIES: zinc ABC transporter substrate-binding protein [Rhodomicrobium]|uniref:zinc ABC transporter substrate-binding protein n=1 Tax=Rhodomicrobium TaxID=1068 RepID=UPI000B4BD040|nr:MULTISPECIES: zinc ABC transporter substrate-binding protein [Rhodomicrobium]